jgi:hypothetical protein
MKLESISPHCEALLRNDGNAIAVEELIAVLLANLKQHPHFGNVLHHIAGGNWDAVANSFREIVLEGAPVSKSSALTRNLYRALSGKGPNNLRPFQQWFLGLVELESSSLFARLVARRIDAANADLILQRPRFRASALRILNSR